MGRGFFPNLVGTNFKGTLIVEAEAGSQDFALAATALTIKEGMLSALPVIPYTASGPTGGTGGSSTATIAFVADLFGSSSLQFQNQTYILSTSYTVPNLAPGTYEMSGTVGSSVAVLFSNGGGFLGTGGVVPGSIENLSGPFPTISACSAIYARPACGLWRLAG